MFYELTCFFTVALPRPQPIQVYHDQFPGPATLTQRPQNEYKLHLRIYKVPSHPHCQAPHHIMIHSTRRLPGPCNWCLGLVTSASLYLQHTGQVTITGTSWHYHSGAPEGKVAHMRSQARGQWQTKRVITQTWLPRFHPYSLSRVCNTLICVPT
jgi:hypothetical protein